MTEESSAEIKGDEAAADKENTENLTWKDLVSRLTVHVVLSLSRVYYKVDCSFL